MAPLLLLSGCGLEQLLFSPAPPPAPPMPLPAASPNAAKTDVSAGLSPLPTPQQVLTAVPFGRSDPFAPLPVASASARPGTAAAAAGAAPAAATQAGGAVLPGDSAAAAAAAGGATPAIAAPPARLVPPEGFRLTGVIRSGGRAEALVSYGPRSGSLRPGDRGGRSTDLLPAGWALASIQFGGPGPQDPPWVALQYGSRRVKVRL